jgi:hypothetical protein
MALVALPPYADTSAKIILVNIGKPLQNYSKTIKKIGIASRP